MTEPEEIGRISPVRLSVLQDRPALADGTYVVYWMTAARRKGWNFALQRAVGWAGELKRPLLIVEVLTCGGRWDCDRHHRFVLQNMVDMSRQLADAPALYNHGLALERSGRAEEAADRYRRAVGVDPAFADAWNNPGVLAARAGRLDEARKHWEKAVESRPGYAPALDNLRRLRETSGSLGSGATEGG